MGRRNSHRRQDKHQHHHRQHRSSHRQREARMMTCHSKGETICKDCTNGRNCLNGRWCTIHARYVEYAHITECSQYKGKP